ncbi:MAG: Unknown protein [uncultured Thiotrichaceae bacterium]|uniref:ChrR-like cupin domain-containing protein n=1 Tax=uncultured Thiotrichaceae bacterium TaxID=298394 RepID=A0A6S6TKC9_9GAMM|nr:MAG: Unknown protein [uncultured Thiotrichaceae bacterium]
MATRKTTLPDTEVLDQDIIELMANAHQEEAPSVEATDRMRSHIMQKISLKKAAKSATPKTVRDSCDDWVNAMPGAKFKVLQGDAENLTGVLSYLIQLEPGFEMAGHEHPFDEETLMLEGDLSLGDIQLQKGDFHFMEAGTTHGNVYTKNGCTAYMRGAFPV